MVNIAGRRWWMNETPFLEIAKLCSELERTSKRNVKTSLLASMMRRLNPNEVSPAVSLILGSVFPEVEKRVLEVSVRTISKVMARKGQSTLIRKPLTVLAVRRYFDEIASVTGKGSRIRKESILESLLSQAQPLERKYLVRMMVGEMRIGASEGLMLEAIAEASGGTLDLVRRSHMSLGDLGQLAEIALVKGKDGLRGLEVQVFSPIRPMMAEMSYDLKEVFAEHGGQTALEFKFDGARIQIHLREGEVRIYSRRLTDVTSSLPDIIELARKELKAGSAIVEGEVVAQGPQGKPLPFQDLMRRFRRVHQVQKMIKEIPLKLHLFDIVYLDGRVLVDAPYRERWNLLSKVCPPSLLAERIVTRDTADAEAFLRKALEAGHEGLMAKALDSPYTPGTRGKRWFKIKPADELDLVIIAADWGYGRRIGWLSNYHLGAFDAGANEFLSLGKTFKGLTDEEFVEMTRRLQDLKVAEDDFTVYVKPEIVVSVAYNEIQCSPHYKSGYALRFARITRVRHDKTPVEADTMERISKLYERQFEHKSRLKANP